MERFTRIIACTDFSPVANRAVAKAFALASRGGEVRLLHCITPPATVNPLYAHYAPASGWSPEQTQGMQAAAIAELDKLVPADAATEGVRAVCEAPLGEPVAEILRLTQEWPADVLVVGSHGHSSLERFFLGSIADRLVREARCPVLVVHELKPAR